MNSLLSNFKLWWKSLDQWILFSTIILIVIGIFLVLSSSIIYGNKLGVNEHYLIRKHLFFIPFCLFIILFFSIFSKENVVMFSFIAFFLFLLLSVIPNFISSEIKGASRWLKVHNLSIQPSEFIKPTFIIVTSTLLTRFQKKHDNSLKINIILLFIIGIILLSQPDFGMFLLISLTWFLQLTLFGISKRIMSALVLLGSVVLFFAYKTLNHVKFRIDSFFEPSIGDKYQINNSIDSFTNGGFFGKGIGAAEISPRIPDVYSDFILSLAAEEFGLVSVFIILTLYGLIFFRSIFHVQKQNDLFFFLSLSGLIIMFITQIMINIFSTLNLIPTKGMTLPFLSYGGSSLISCSVLIGFILSFSKKNDEKR